MERRGVIQPQDKTAYREYDMENVTEVHERRGIRTKIVVNQPENQKPDVARCPCNKTYWSDELCQAVQKITGNAGGCLRYLYIIETQKCSHNNQDLKNNEENEAYM
jgi:hypothetical protein